MRILFYFGHPSQYLFLKNPINILKGKGFSCDIIIKSKDVLERLLIENNEPYYNILPEGRASCKFGIITGLIKRDYRLFRFVKNKNYDLFIGTDPSLAHIGFLKRIPVITVLEDDISVIPELARITFPFTSLILTPKECQTGMYEKKTIHYDGYMKLAYLHPVYFSAKDSHINKPYFLIRLSGLKAYHDQGINGLNESLLDSVIAKLSERGVVYISSEKPLSNKYDGHLPEIKHSDIHHFLANTEMLISDSQSMSMEAAMLGVPSIRFSDFAGRISVLEELEQKYELTFGIPTSNPQQLIDKIDELLSHSGINEIFQLRRQKMLSEKIDVTAFMVWFIENYPKSAEIMKENPDYQYRFKQELGTGE